MFPSRAKREVLADSLAAWAKHQVRQGVQSLQQPVARVLRLWGLCRSRTCNCQSTDQQTLQGDRAEAGLVMTQGR
ncbi:MAG: hypothetical protein R2864_04080 [Syntrophotaleaceae bacterium]